MKITLLLLDDPRMSDCFACKCPFVNDWKRYSLTLRRFEFGLENVWVWPWEGVRQSWRVLLTLRDPSSSSWSSWRGTWRTTQRLLDPANQAWDVSLSFRACIVWTIWMNPNNIQMMLSICFRKPSLMIRLCTSTFYLLTEIKETECFLWIGWIEATLFIEFVRTILSSLGNKGSISVQLSR